VASTSQPISSLSSSTDAYPQKKHPAGGSDDLKITKQLLDILIDPNRFSTVQLIGDFWKLGWQVHHNPLARFLARLMRTLKKNTLLADLTT
jgi:hypothetical protein